MDDQKVMSVIGYHEQTKHHYDRYARSPGNMDWHNQPNPFRFYRGRPPQPLPFLKCDPEGKYENLYRQRPPPSRPVTLDSIAALLELSLGLSAWKSTQGNRWPLRINPSSGNLHPTEAHLVIPAAGNLPAGVYHYNPLLHALEPRARIPAAMAGRLSHELGSDTFLMALTSIFWRESWKYGERAFRYCNHDVGHALAAMSFSAILLGWRLTCLNGISDDQIETVLGFDRTEFPPLEAEHPDLLCLIHPADRPPAAPQISRETTAGFGALVFDLTPSSLSRERVNWDIIYRTAERTRKPETPATLFEYEDRPIGRRAEPDFPAARIIRQRRSAVEYDPQGRLFRDRFLVMLDRTLPRANCAPFDCGLGEPAVNLLVFVHRVEGLESGLYFFLRCRNDLEPIRRLSHKNFLWTTVENGLPLYLLRTGDYRREATMVSCHQEIAGQSVASFGMLARFKKVLQQAPYRYRQLFWETGLIGQVLYLEAEAAAKRGTGIGCFFDDAVHDLMGFEDNRYQSLYHFTLGDPVEDMRLSTHSPYDHIDKTGR